MESRGAKQEGTGVSAGSRVRRKGGGGSQGESDSHDKPSPQRAKGIAQNEDGPGGGGGGGATPTPTPSHCRKSWPQISQLGGRVLDRTREGAQGDGEERLGGGERQMDGGVMVAAGYRQGRNCVSGAHCQKYVSIMEIVGEKKRQRER